MSRRNLIALGGSVAFVLLAFWLVTLAFPRHDDVIFGKWRTKNDTECIDALLYFVFSQDTIVLQARGDVPRVLAKISAVETEGDRHRLRFYLADRSDLDIDAPYQIAGDELTFSDIDWSPEARAKHPDDVAALATILAAKGQSISGVLTRFQPFHRCSD